MKTMTFEQPKTEAQLPTEEDDFEPEYHTLSTAEARSRFAEIVNRAGYGYERFALTRRGKPVAAIVPFETLALIQRIEDEMDNRAAEEAREDIRINGTIPWEQVKAKAGL